MRCVRRELRQGISPFGNFKDRSFSNSPIAALWRMASTSDEMAASLLKLNPQASVFVMPTFAPPPAGPPPSRHAPAPVRELKVSLSDFLPSDVFAGPQPGMSFKHGPHGLGYYADKRLARQQAGPDAAGAKKKKKSKKKAGEDGKDGNAAGPATAAAPAAARKAGQPAGASSAAPAASAVTWASRAAAVAKPAAGQPSDAKAQGGRPGKGAKREQVDPYNASTAGSAGGGASALQGAWGKAAGGRGDSAGRGRGRGDGREQGSGSGASGAGAGAGGGAGGGGGSGSGSGADAGGGRGAGRGRGRGRGAGGGGGGGGCSGGAAAAAAEVAAAEAEAYESGPTACGKCRPAEGTARCPGLTASLPPGSCLRRAPRTRHSPRCRREG